MNDVFGVLADVRERVVGLHAAARSGFISDAGSGYDPYAAFTNIDEGWHVDFLCRFETKFQHFRINPVEIDAIGTVAANCSV